MWEKMETKTIVYDLDTSGGLMEVRVVLLIPFPSAGREPPPSAPQSRPQTRSARGPGIERGFFLTQSSSHLSIWVPELSL